MTHRPKYDLLIHNGTAVTVNKAFDILGNALVCIRDGRIASIGETDPAKKLPEADTVIDAHGGIIMPGLVNTHTHVPMSLFRGLADDLPLSIWLNDHIFPAEARHVDPEFVRWATWLACTEMALGGITTCCDGYFYEEQVADAFNRFGMRAVAGQGIIDFPAPGVADPAKNIATARAFAEKISGQPGTVTASLFCHSPYTCSAGTLRRAKAVANELSLLFQIHVAETESELKQCLAEHQTSPVQYLDRTGVLDDRTLLVHAVWVGDEDIELIADRGASVSHNPESNMKLGAGVAPVNRLLKAGVKVGIGTDGCASNNNLDLFREMGITAKLHKAVSGDPTVLDAQTVIRMATIEGASAIGLDDLTGSLESGKAADLIIMDTRKPHLTPMYRPDSHIVYAAKASDVKTVVIGGRIIVKNRDVLTMDTSEILRAAGQLGREIKTCSARISNQEG